MWFRSQKLLPPLAIIIRTSCCQDGRGLMLVISACYVKKLREDLTWLMGKTRVLMRSQEGTCRHFRVFFCNKLSRILWTACNLRRQISNVRQQVKRYKFTYFHILVIIIYQVIAGSDCFLEAFSQIECARTKLHSSSRHTWQDYFLQKEAPTMRYIFK